MKYVTNLGIRLPNRTNPTETHTRAHPSETSVPWDDTYVLWLVRAFRTGEPIESIIAAQSHAGYPFPGVGVIDQILADHGMCLEDHRGPMGPRGPVAYQHRDWSMWPPLSARHYFVRDDLDRSRLMAGWEPSEDDDDEAEGEGGERAGEKKSAGKKKKQEGAGKCRG
jgi:hypothetical protein